MIRLGIPERVVLAVEGVGRGPRSDWFIGSFAKDLEAQQAFARLALSRSLMIQEAPSIDHSFGRGSEEAVQISFACDDDRIRAIVGVHAGIDCFRSDGVYEELLSAHVYRGAALLAAGPGTGLMEMSRLLLGDTPSKRWRFETFDETLEAAICAVGVDADVVAKRLGHSVRSYELVVREPSDPAEWRRALAALEAIVCEADGRIRCATGVNGGVQLEIPKPGHLRSRLRWEAHGSEHPNEAGTRSEIVPGTDLDGRPRSIDSDPSGVVLVVGSRGSGVTNVTAALAASIASGGAFRLWVYGRPALFEEVAKGPARALRNSGQLRDRLLEFAKQAETGGSAPEPPPAVVAELGRTECEDPSMIAAIRLAAAARGAGLLVVAASRAPAFVLAETIAETDPVRLILRTSNADQSRKLAGKPGAELLAGRGDLLVVAPGRDDVRMQSFHMSSPGEGFGLQGDPAP